MPLGVVYLLADWSSEAGQGERHKAGVLAGGIFVEYWGQVGRGRRAAFPAMPRWTARMRQARLIRRPRAGANPGKRGGWLCAVI